MRIVRHILALLLDILSMIHAAAQLTHDINTQPLQALPSAKEYSTQYAGVAENQESSESHIRGVHDDGSRINGRSMIPSILHHEAAHIWKRERVYATIEYWGRTPETIRESKGKEFFAEWLSQYESGSYKDECNNKNLTIMQCFASIWWGDFNFRCTIDQTELCSVPTATNITAWIQQRHASWPTSQVIDTARKVFFAYKHFQAVTSNLKTDWDLIFKVGMRLAVEAHALLMGFTPQHDSVRLASCQFTQDLSQILVDIFIQAGIVGLNLGQFTGAMRTMSETADGLMVQARVTGDYTKAVRAAQRLNLARNSIYYTQWTTGEVRKYQASSKRLGDAIYNAKESVVVGRTPPRLEFPLIKGHDFCGNVFGVIENSSEQQVDEMIKYINTHLDGLRYAISTLFDSLFIKDEDALGDVALRDLMIDIDWDDVSTRDYGDLEVSVLGLNNCQEQQLTHHRRAISAVRNALLSETLAASRQYLKCEDREDAAELCAENDGSMENDLRVYCPPDYPRLRCQSALWTKRQVGNHEKPLTGLEKDNRFAELSIKTSDLFDNSLTRYFLMGADSYSDRGLYIEGKPIASHKMVHLPVSVSKVRTIGSSRNFPYSSGDWTSNHTPAFLDRIHVNVSDEGEMRGVLLHRHLKMIPEPANRFMLLCQLNLRWPNQGEIRSGVARAAKSPICQVVMPKIQNLDEFEGNYRFCTMDAVRTNTFKHEKSFIPDIERAIPSHHKLCERWFRANSFNIERRFGSAALWLES